MTSSSSLRKHKDKREKKKKKRRKIKRKKRSSRASHTEVSNVNYGSGEEGINLNEELHSIGFYINDREEMINQMFSIIKPDKIRAMLPPVLKESSMEELKAYCLEELLGMSIKRISSVLEGRELDTSSESDDGSMFHENENNAGAISTDNKSHSRSMEMKRMGTQESDLEEMDKDEERNGPGNDMDTLEIGITREEMGELLNCMPSSKKGDKKSDKKRHSDNPEPGSSGAKRSKLKHRKSKDLEIPQKSSKKSIELENSKNTSPERKKSEEGSNSETEDNPSESKGKTLLEILELEMRARAIRALLKQQVGTGEGDDIEIGTPSGSEEHGEATKESTANITEEKGRVHSNAEKELSSPHPDNCEKGRTDEEESTSTRPIRLKRKGLGNITSGQSANSLSFDADSSNSISSLQQKTDSDSQIVDLSILQDDVHSHIKSEVPSNDEQTVPELDAVNKDLEIRTPKVTELEDRNEPDREDGELTSDAEKSSFDSVLEIQPEGGSSDIIVLDDSDDDLSDVEKNTSMKKIEHQKEIDPVQKGNEKHTCMSSDDDSSTGVKKDIKKVKVSKKDIIKSKYLPDPNSSQFLLDSKSSKDKNVTSDVFVEHTKDGKISAGTTKKGDTPDVSWAARWLQSKGVQKVVSTSKMCAKIRNRMKSAQKEKKFNAEAVQTEETKPSLVIVGSVNEYNMLDKPKVGEKENTENSEKLGADKN